MPIKITPVKLGKPKIKALIYGDPGVGKTVLAATSNGHPEMANALVANIDDGLISIASRKGLLEARIKSVEELEELQGMAARNAPEFGGVQTIIIDSGTELYEETLRQIALREFKKKNRTDRDKNQIEDYGEATSKLNRVFRWCRDLDYHVIMTALAKVDRKPVDTRKKSKHDAPVLRVAPKFSEKLGTAIMACFDYVWYMYADEKKTEDKSTEIVRYLLTQPSGVVEAKTRGEHFAPKLGRVVKNPNLAEIYSLLLSTENKND